MTDRAERISSIFNRMQVVGFAVDSIAAQPDKVPLNRSRAENAQKQLKRIETELRELLDMPSREEIRGALATAERESQK